MDKQYNMNLKKYIILDEGEQFCPKCKGKGQVRIKNATSVGALFSLKCDKCLGDGKIDWIEKVTGKKVKYIGYGGVGANTVK